MTIKSAKAKYYGSPKANNNGPKKHWYYDVNPEYLN